MNGSVSAGPDGCGDDDDDDDDTVADVDIDASDGNNDPALKLVTLN